MPLEDYSDKRQKFGIRPDRELFPKKKGPDGKYDGSKVYIVHFPDESKNCIHSMYYDADNDVFVDQLCWQFTRDEFDIIMTIDEYNESRK